MAAQCLFLRLHPRRGPWFRLGGHAYSEVPEPAAAARALADAGLAALLERAGPAGARRGCMAGRAGPLSAPRGVISMDTCACMHVCTSGSDCPAAKQRSLRLIPACFTESGRYYRELMAGMLAGRRAGRGARADAEAVVNVLTAPELAALAARLKLHPPGRASGNSRAQLLARVAGALRAGELPAASGLRVRRGRRSAAGAWRGMQRGAVRVVHVCQHVALIKVRMSRSPQSVQGPRASLVLRRRSDLMQEVTAGQATDGSQFMAGARAPARERS